MIAGGTALLADGHANVPSEAVGSGLGVWWLLVAVLGLLTVACGTGFVAYLRRTAAQRWQSDVSTAAEPS